MVGTFKIMDEIERTTTPYNEIILLKTIKALKGRNDDLRNIYIRIYEDLTEKEFNEKLLKLI